MANQNLLNTDNEQLRAVLHGLTMTQIRFAVARLNTKTDKAAAEAIGLVAGSVAQWDNKAQVDEAVALMRYDGIITALEIRRRHLAEAMAVKVEGLKSGNEKIKQDSATEIIEWELGKAQQKTDITTGGDKLTISLMWPEDDTK